MKVSVIVPAYNERDTIGPVIERLLALPLEKQIVIVDDGSTDGTREVLQALNHPEVEVVLQPENRGKGAAIRSGLERASGEVVVIQDADLEYTPEEIPMLVRPILEGSAEVVYGSRFRGRCEGMRRINRLANWFFAKLANLLFRSRITDEATCYKAFRTDLLRSLDLQCERFEFCPEVTAKMGLLGKDIMEIPITYRGRSFAQGKKIRWRDGVEVITTLLRWRFSGWGRGNDRHR